MELLTTSFSLKPIAYRVWAHDSRCTTLFQVKPSEVKVTSWRDVTGDINLPPKYLSHRLGYWYLYLAMRADGYRDSCRTIVHRSVPSYWTCGIMATISPALNHRWPLTPSSRTLATSVTILSLQQLQPMYQRKPSSRHMTTNRYGELHYCWYPTFQGSHNTDWHCQPKKMLLMLHNYKMYRMYCYSDDAIMIHIILTVYF